MADGPTPRIMKETNNLKVEKIPGIFCEVDPNNFRHFFVKIEGNSHHTQDQTKPATKEENSTQNYSFQMTTQ